MQHGQADLALISRNDDQRIEQTVDGVWRGSKEVVRSRRPSADVDFRSRAFARTADDLALAYGMLFPVAERRNFPVRTANSDCTG